MIERMLIGKFYLINYIGGQMILGNVVGRVSVNLFGRQKREE